MHIYALSRPSHYFCMRSILSPEFVSTLPSPAYFVLVQIDTTHIKDRERTKLYRARHMAEDAVASAHAPEIPADVFKAIKYHRSRS